MSRDFNAWLSGFRDSIADYGYYIDFEKVHRNVDNIKVELNILNSLIASKDIETDFENLMRKYPEVLKEFALNIGMVPIIIKKEVPGYVMNSLLIPFLMAGMGLLANGVADAETIDKDWKLTMCAPIGPFEELDYIGVPTAYHVVKNNPQSADPNSTMGKIKAMLEKMISEGKTGREAGEGFYKY